MKILELRDFGNTDAGTLPTLVLTTDSSVVRDNRPVFLPEISRSWRCDFMVAYMMCRLGKSISRRFAPRYYDRMTVAVRFVPVDVVDAGDGKGQWTPWATAFDGAIALGTPVECTPEIEVDITAPCASVIKGVAPPVDMAVAMLSENMIIKTGDIIIPPAPLFSCPVKIGDRVEAAIDGNTVLRFNVK